MPRLYDPSAALEALNTLSGFERKSEPKASAAWKTPTLLGLLRGCDKETDEYRPAEAHECRNNEGNICRATHGKPEVNLCDGACYCHRTDPGGTTTHTRTYI